ncbi:DUF742 domain-containing protein [Mycobacterium yunnanensis]|uniref:DUF742 domain-containing protein n=1 Tax=Mycobacterium yunnanensis TaxID=368477 RepID=A0A9X3BTM0_9MYCO|nr:DUF742 domain-containing protein [Mycobacterium yunnanensis]MCV7421804.1 DUF742 domain-containing protein [Mycobacterium yunnanensis]
MTPPSSDASEPSEPLIEVSMVRPYTLTGGRTASSVDLPLEAPIRTSRPGPAPTWPSSDVRAKILDVGEDGPSVAEVAARLALPLGVARVLIGDLVEQDYLRVDAYLGESATTDERRELIGRTLRGLRAL